MTPQNQMPDKTLLKNIIQKLARGGGGSQSNVTATVRSGEVTLAGTIGYETHRSSILRSTNSVTGVRRVIDQMRVAPRKTSWA